MFSMRAIMGYKNALEFVILSSKHWLRIEQKSVFLCYHTPNLNWSGYWPLGRASNGGMHVLCTHQSYRLFRWLQATFSQFVFANVANNLTDNWWQSMILTKVSNNGMTTKGDVFQICGDAYLGHQSLCPVLSIVPVNESWGQVGHLLKDSKCTLEYPWEAFLPQVLYEHSQLVVEIDWSNHLLAWGSGQGMKANIILIWISFRLS